MRRQIAPLNATRAKGMSTTISDQRNRALSIADAAKALTVSERTIWRLIESGTLKSVRVSERRRVIPAPEIDRILAGGGEGA
jgi:excisionase family DNA binding protein